VEKLRGGRGRELGGKSHAGEAPVTPTTLKGLGTRWVHVGSGFVRSAGGGGLWAEVGKIGFGLVSSRVSNIFIESLKRSEPLDLNPRILLKLKYVGC
jgi:hypothetical protein